MKQDNYCNFALPVLLLTLSTHLPVPFGSSQEGTA